MENDNNEIYEGDMYVGNDSIWNGFITKFKFWSVLVLVLAVLVVPWSLGFAVILNWFL